MIIEFVVFKLEILIKMHIILMTFLRENGIFLHHAVLILIILNYIKPISSPLVDFIVCCSGKNSPVSSKSVIQENSLNRRSSMRYSKHELCRLGYTYCAFNLHKSN